MVGIGTDPTENLHVYGTAYISGATTMNSTLNVNGNVTLENDDTTDMTYVNSSLSFNEETTTSGSATKDGATIKFVSDYLGNTNDALVIEKTDKSANGTVDGGIVFATRGGTGTVINAMVIRGDGDIGVGKTTHIYIRC